MKTQDRIILKYIVEAEHGLTITELEKQTLFTRSAIRTSLTRLEALNEIVVKQVGMAKLNFIKFKDKKKSN